MFTTRMCFAIVSGLPLDTQGMEIVRKWQSTGFVPVKPVEVKTGPVMANVRLGNDVNLLELPKLIVEVAQVEFTKREVVAPAQLLHDADQFFGQLIRLSAA